jgi:hypothetical protein
LTELVDRVKKESLNSALVKNNLLETADTRNCIGNMGASLQDACLIRLLERALEYVIYFDLASMGKAKRVKDLQSSALETIRLVAEYLEAG